MLFTTAEAEKTLTKALGKTSRRHVYYLLDMGILEATKARSRWRVWSFSVEDYVKRQSKNYFTNSANPPECQGGSGLSGGPSSERLQDDLFGGTYRLQGRRASVEHPQKRPRRVLGPELKPVVQLEFELELSA